MKNFILILCLIFSNIVFSQDVHFSQLEHSIFLSNPSLIGYQKTDYEIQIQRRSQWSRVTAPFNTLALSLNIKEFYNRFSFAASFLNDISGDSDFSTNGVALSFIKSIKIKDNVISMAFQPAFYQRKIDYSRLLFLQQPEFFNQKFTFLDLTTGFSNKFFLNKNNSFLIGLAAHHINTPPQSLIKDNTVFLNTRIVTHSKWEKKLYDKLSFDTGVYFSTQDSQNELLFGAGTTYELEDNLALKSACYVRMRDALIVNFGVKTNQVQVIASYDINTSSFSNATNYMGAFEFTVSYAWNVNIQTEENYQPKNCPNYL